MAVTHAERFRVLDVQPVTGGDHADPRTDPVPGAHGTAIGPAEEAAFEWEGQVVELADLEGMGRIQWLNEDTLRLDTATGSYRLQMAPIPGDATLAEAHAETAALEAARMQHPSGTSWPWLTWLIVALIALAVIGAIWIVSGNLYRF